jgi:hypothetical protein
MLKDAIMYIVFNTYTPLPILFTSEGARNVGSFWFSYFYVSCLEPIRDSELSEVLFKTSVLQFTSA